MKPQKRYGNYPFLNITSIIIFICIVIGIWGIIFDWPFYLTLYFFFSGVGGFIYSYHHFTEKFYIEGNVIFHQKGLYKEQIIIPDDAVFVLSHSSTNLVLFNKFTINIVAEDAGKIIEKLHQNELANATVSSRRGLFKTASYDNKIVRGYFKNRWIYCFLYDKTYAEEFFSSQQKTIIIPLTIADKIDLNIEKYSVIIDEKA